jgi:UDP-N-acetylmuramoylalanine--D-glutamate ligase
MDSLRGARVLILGLGISGRSAATHCAREGARVTAADERAPERLEGLDALVPGIDLRLGQPFPDPGDFDLVVPSPGVPAERYRARAPRVWGDLELLWRALPVPLVAITGTNGKSTTTRLLEAMLRAAGLRARAAGNIGEPALELVGQPLDVAVLEVSSFQLEAIADFRPRVAVILNLTPDHLDRHGDFDAYVAAKARILENQGSDDVAVLNFDDAATRGLADAARGRVLPFRSGGPLEHGAWVDAGAVVLREAGQPPQRIALDSLALPGRHNRENAVAALAACAALGVDGVAAAGAWPSFRGLRHRSEPVGVVDGVHFVNDSKATNPGAALRALEEADGALVWIAGGRDKGLDFGELAEVAARRVRAAVLIGEAAGTLKDALGGRVEVHAAASLGEAVASAARLARPGDTVLLSPACASQDQFRDFEERGDAFRSAVARLAKGVAR